VADDPTDAAAIADRIRAYLSARPFAADAVRGVIEWWIGPVEPPPTAALVEDALLLLEAEGAVVADRNADRTAIWRASDAFRAAHAPRGLGNGAPG
jgi:hypothetical protein